MEDSSFVDHFPIKIMGFPRFLCVYRRVATKDITPKLTNLDDASGTSELGASEVVISSPSLPLRGSLSMRRTWAIALNAQVGSPSHHEFQYEHGLMFWVIWLYL